MGYLSCVMVYNDESSNLRDDPELGRHLYHALAGWNARDRDRYKTRLGRHNSKVVSQGHADHPQIVMLWQNRAIAFDDPFDQHADDEMIDFAIKRLKELKWYRALKVKDTPNGQG